MIINKTDEPELPQIVNLSQVNVETVQAELVRTSQTIIQTLSAEEVDLQTSMVNTIQTGNLHAHGSLIGASASQQATLQDSIAGGLRAETINFNGVSAFTLANNLESKGLNAIGVISTNISADEIRTGLLISREVHGNVTTTLDRDTALLAGLLGGITAGLIFLLGRWITVRNK